MPIFCRVCGEPIFNLQPRNLFIRENATIRKNIEAIVGIELQYNSEMPSHICSCCYLDLEHSMSFRRRCLETHKQLLNGQEKETSDSEILPTQFPQIDPLEEKMIKTETTVAKLKEKQSVRRRNESNETVRAKRVLPEQTQVATKPKRKRQPYTSLEKKFTCDVCGWAFRDISNLKSHVLRHSGEKKFKCKECDWKFFDKPRLLLHVRVIHRGEKPFICKYCGMGFSNSPARCRHERKSHPQQLPFKCDICNKTFVSKTSLNSHKTLHVTGEVIHHCDTCNKTFTKIGTLRRHFTTKYHYKRLQPAVKNNDTDTETLSDTDEDIDFDFSDSIIEEVDE